MENIAGQLALDIVVTGTPSAPQPRGTLQVINGGFGARDLGIQVNNFALSAQADLSRVTVTQLSARSGGGTLDGSGVITLKDLKAQNLDLRIAARRWPAIQTERYRAIVEGDMRLGGALTAPAITGKVRVVEGTLRPDLSVLDRNAVPLKRDPSIVVVQHRGGAPIQTTPAEKNNGAPKTDLWRVLAIDLGVSVPNNLWIRHSNAEVELSGDLNLIKRPGAEPTVTGAIEAVRGWLGFQGRRFTINRGRIQFTGGQPIDPIIDVVAEYRVNENMVNAIAGGRASKPTLVLASQPQMEQSDILALLLFGKTTKDLSGGEQVSLQKNAIDITSSFAAAQLGRAVTNALGLESLGVDISDGSQVRFGHYVGRQTYVSASQQVSGEYGREFKIEYQLTPQIKVDATTTISGNSGVDIIWHKRY
jgi:translocation and assembly module TamB